VLVGGAPVGHRQRHTRDVPSENPNNLDHISAEDAGQFGEHWREVRRAEQRQA
jgi:hypothetical protein